MNAAILSHFKDWFDSYTRRFYLTDPAEQKNIALKVEHSERVRAVIATLAEGLSLPHEHVYLAEAVGLFHDVGRFPQYARYKTFRDSISVNHGKLGAEVLAEERVLIGLPETEQAIIDSCVRFHNAFSIPDLPSIDVVLFLRLIRDADKLDIWRIFIEFFEMSAEERPSDVVLGLTDDPRHSTQILNAIYRKQTASMAHLKTLNDFKLMQLSWVFDLNFRPSFELLKENRYLDKLFALLPRTEEIQRAADFLHDFVAEKTKTEGESSTEVRL